MKVHIEIEFGPNFEQEVREAIAHLQGLLPSPVKPKKHRKPGRVQQQVLDIINKLGPGETITTQGVAIAMFGFCDDTNRNKAWGPLSSLWRRGMIRKMKHGTWGSVP